MKSLEQVLYRTLTGKIPIEYDRKKLFITAPTIENKHRAEELYQEIHYEHSFSPMIPDDEILFFMAKHGLWSAEEEDQLNKAEQDVETYKVELFQSYFQSKRKETVRKFLAAAKTEHARLLNKRHSLDYLTPKGIAHFVRIGFLVGTATVDSTNCPILSPSTFLSASMDFVNRLIEEYYAGRADEKTIRKIAREEPWRSYWNTAKKENKLFGVSPLEYSEDQKLLVLWSSLYDSVYENSESPGDDVIEDDDCLDGWLILQKQKATKTKLKNKENELLKNDKIRNSQEIFFMADTLEDAKKINELNSTEAKLVKQSRFKAIREKGEINEADLPDVKRNIMMNLNKMTIERIKKS